MVTSNALVAGSGDSTPVKRLLTPDDAARAIYIDFEGRENHAPVLLGVVYAEGRKVPDPSRVVLRQDVLDGRFSTLVRAADVHLAAQIHRYDGDVLHFRTAVSNVVQRAVIQQRHIVAWSRHELDAVREYGGDALASDFESLFVDGKVTARRWLKTAHPELVPSRADRGGAHKLAHYLRVVGWDVPPECGEGVVGAGLRAIDACLEMGRSWDTMTARQRRAWWRIVNHNAHDCLGLRAVVQTAAAELASHS